MSTKKSILITGANGLLGSHLVEALAPLYEVHVIVHTPPTKVISGVFHHVIDLGSSWNVEVLPSKIDAVVHLAQSSHFREVPQKALDVFNVNVASTARLLDYAYRVGAGKFLYASSGGIYGAGNQAFHENSPIVPPDHLGYYLGSKLSGEVLVQSYAAHMQVLVLRFFFIYGPGQNRAMLIPRLVDSVREGRPITIQGEEGLKINPIHVSDATTAAIAALNSVHSATYNIAGPQVLSLRALCKLIEDLTGSSAVYTSAPGIPRDTVGDTSAMRATLHVPSVLPVDGLKDML